MQLPIGGFCSASANFGQSTCSTRMGELPFFKKKHPARASFSMLFASTFTTQEC